MVIRFGGRNAPAKFGLNFVRTNTLIRDSDGRGRDEDFSSPTGSPKAVARPRLPQNVACGFPAPRSSAVGSQLSLLSVQVSFPWSADLLSEWKAVTPVAWSPCRPRTIQLPLTASPCSRLSRPQSTISQSDIHPVIRPFSPLRLGRSYRLAPEPDGSPLFALLPLVACWRYEPREHLRPLAIARAAIPPSPLRDRVGYSDHDRFRGYVPVHCRSGLQPPCLRFAAAVTGRHARLGTRLLARLYRGRHLRRLSSTRLQGATRTDPSVRY